MLTLLPIADAAIRSGWQTSVAYQMLLYTGQRKAEVRALGWSEPHLESVNPYVLFRVDTMKDESEKRTVPLRREIAAKPVVVRPKDFDPTQRVFCGAGRPMIFSWAI